MEEQREGLEVDVAGLFFCCWGVRERWREKRKVLRGRGFLFPVRAGSKGAAVGLSFRRWIRAARTAPSSPTKASKWVPIGSRRSWLRLGARIGGKRSLAATGRQRNEAAPNRRRLSIRWSRRRRPLAPLAFIDARFRSIRRFQHAQPPPLLSLPEGETSGPKSRICRRRRRCSRRPPAQRAGRG